MPILDVELTAPAPGRPPASGVPSPDRARWPSGLAAALAEAAAEVFRTPPGETWVRLRALDEGGYAENGAGDGAPPPVFVSVLLADSPAGDARRSLAARLAAAVAGATGHPVERVHILFEAPARGRIAFGGVLVE